MEEIPSGPLTLSGYLARPLRSDGEVLRDPRPAVVICHGLPAAPGGGATAGRSYHVLADRIAVEMGWSALVLNYRGCGLSEGDFSLLGWVTDVRAAVEFVSVRTRTRGIWVAGFGTGGAVAIRAAAGAPAVTGAVSVGAPVDFADWAANSERLLRHARETGVVRDDLFPPDRKAWRDQFASFSTAAAADRLAPRPLMVVHGSDDELVPPLDARAIADAHGAADLRIIAAGGHRLRYDPRCISLVLGWLDRHGHDMVLEPATVDEASLAETPTAP
ncbi:MAG: alpha/beta hydrolase [bacterium]|nr:alpha/beta hydrolase [bacterium]MCY4102432.1 alpha/beta hydrolase [bacterium]